MKGEISSTGEVTSSVSWLVALAEGAGFSGSL